MKRLNSINRENEASELEIPYPVYPEEITTEGYYGAVKEGDEKLLLRNIFSTIRKHWLLILIF